MHNTITQGSQRLTIDTSTSRKAASTFDWYFTLKFGKVGKQNNVNTGQDVEQVARPLDRKSDGNSQCFLHADNCKEAPQLCALCGFVLLHLQIKNNSISTIWSLNNLITAVSAATNCFM